MPEAGQYSARIREACGRELYQVSSGELAENKVLTFFLAFAFLFRLHVAFFRERSPDRTEIGHGHALQSLLRLSELFICRNPSAITPRSDNVRT